MTANIKNQRIVITGITGGIALATAQRLAELGADVIVSARDQARLERSIAALSEKLKGTEAGNVSGYLMDLNDDNSIRQLFERVGRFDHLVTPAASSVMAPIADMNFEGARQLLESKQWGQMLCVHHALNTVRKDGSITLFSGTVTQKPLPGSSMYAAVGAATEAAARVWALEQAPLRVNTIVPGIIATDVWAGLMGSEAAAQAQLSALGEGLPVGRIGMPLDIAKAVSFLIDNEFVNGASLVVDGGHRLV